VFFEDGSEETGDVLVGTDGAGSRLRAPRLPHARMEDTGIVSIGGKLALDQGAALGQGLSRALSEQMWRSVFSWVILGHERPIPIF
jgi:hypothetical protein